MFAVAPLAGAWIEIEHCKRSDISTLSLPSRERGLKLYYVLYAVCSVLVAPLAGAWIEIKPE